MGIEAIGIVGALILGARIYLALLPVSPALGALVVIAAGGLVALVFLEVEQRLASARMDGAGAPPQL